MGNKIVIKNVEKEEIKFLHFPKEDVLFAKEDVDTRNRNLQKAISLGNIGHHKVRILFQDIEGNKQVETTIWGLTDKEIILKQGVILPINRVTDVFLI